MSHWLENTGQKTSKLSGQALQMYARELEDQQRCANVDQSTVSEAWVPNHGTAGKPKDKHRLDRVNERLLKDVDHGATNERVLEIREDKNAKSERSSEHTSRRRMRRMRRKRDSAKMASGAEEHDISVKYPRLDNGPHAMPLQPDLLMANHHDANGATVSVSYQDGGSGTTVQQNGTQANPIDIDPAPAKLVDFDDEPPKLIDIDDEPSMPSEGATPQEVTYAATDRVSCFSSAAQRVLDELHASMNKLSNGMNCTRETLYNLWDKDETLQDPGIRPHLKQLDERLEAAVDELKTASEMFTQLPTLETYTQDENDFLDEVAVAEAELQAGVDERLGELEAL